MLTRCAILVIAVLGCSPSRYALPSKSLRYASAMIDEGGLRAAVTPVTSESQLQARFKWREHPMYWGVRLGLQDRDLVLPLVPLPSLEVVLENSSDQPVSFADAQITLEDDAGRRHRFAAQPDEYLARVVDQLLARTPELWFIRQEWGPMESLPAYPGPYAWYGPILALLDVARKVPLFGPQVVVPPHGRWVGAIVLSDTAGSPEEIAAQLKGTWYVRWSGARAGERVLEPQELLLSLEDRADHVMCADGRRAESPDACTITGYLDYRKDGPCIQLGVQTRYHNGKRITPSQADAQWIDGKRVTDVDMQSALLDLPSSKGAEKKSLQLKTAGWVLMAGGVFGAAGTAAGIGGAGYLKEAPAGVSVLAVSGVGAILYYLGQRSHYDAVRDFNRYAFKTGACAAPL